MLGVTLKNVKSKNEYCTTLFDIHTRQNFEKLHELQKRKLGLLFLIIMITMAEVGCKTASSRKRSLNSVKNSSSLIDLIGSGQLCAVSGR